MDYLSKCSKEDDFYQENKMMWTNLHQQVLWWLCNLEHGYKKLHNMRQDVRLQETYLRRPRRQEVLLIVCSSM